MSCPSRCQLPHQVKRMHSPVVACNSHLIRFQAIVRIQSDTFERSWKSVLRALLCCCVHRYTLIRRISHGSTACVKSVSSVSWKMTMMNVWAKRCGKSASHVVWKGVKCAFIYFKKAGSFSTRHKRAARCCLGWCLLIKTVSHDFLILSPSSSSCYWMETSVKLHPFLLRWRRRHLARNESAFHVHIFHFSLSTLFSFEWICHALLGRRVSWPSRYGISYTSRNSCNWANEVDTLFAMHKGTNKMFLWRNCPEHTVRLAEYRQLNESHFENEFKEIETYTN